MGESVWVRAASTVAMQRRDQEPGGDANRFRDAVVLDARAAAWQPRARSHGRESRLHHLDRRRIGGEIAHRPPRRELARHGSGAAHQLGAVPMRVALQRQHGGRAHQRQPATSPCSTASRFK